MEEKICQCPNPSGATVVSSPIDTVESCADCGKISKADAENLQKQNIQSDKGA